MSDNFWGHTREYPVVTGYSHPDRGMWPGVGCGMSLGEQARKYTQWGQTRKCPRWKGNVPSVNWKSGCTTNSPWEGHEIHSFSSPDRRGQTVEYFGGWSANIPEWTECGMTNVLEWSGVDWLISQGWCGLWNVQGISIFRPRVLLVLLANKIRVSLWRIKSIYDSFNFCYEYS